MGRIDISFETVRQKSDKLNGQIQSKLEKEMIAGYERLESSILQSGGDAVETIVEELRQEKNTLIEMKNFMIKLLQLMQESADAFEETDISYQEAVQNLGQGGIIAWQIKAYFQRIIILFQRQWLIWVLKSTI